MPKIKVNATARCHPKDKADNRGVAEGEDGYFNGTTGLPVGIHLILEYYNTLEVNMSNNEMPHEGHDQHLCALHGDGLLKDNFEEWKRLVSNGQFVCGGCGRVANSSENLCDPQKL